MVAELENPLIPKVRLVLRYLMAVAFFAAGVMHFLITEDYMTIMPPLVPGPRAMVLFTGVCEMIGAAGLLIPGVRKLAGVMLAIFLVCVYPANLYMAIDHVPFRGVVPSWTYHTLRLAFQPVMIWWALFCSGLIAWPFVNERPTGPNMKSLNTAKPSSIQKSK